MCSRGRSIERGIEIRLTPHGLRRTWNDLGRRLAKGIVVRSILGHGSEAMTDHYSVVDDGERRDVVESVSSAIGGSGGRRIYLASSWRNERQPEYVELLRAGGHMVYDFRNPLGPESGGGFDWRTVDGNWQEWSPEEFRQGLAHPIAQAGFQADWSAMHWADTFVLLLPCGRSAHLEAGWAIGAGKPTCFVLAEGEPELMYGMATRLAVDERELLAWLGGFV